MTTTLSTGWTSCRLLALVIVLIHNVGHLSGVRYIPACDREVFCQGDVLHAVQMARVYDDSKTFVDMRYKGEPQTAMAKLKAAVDGKYSKQQWKDLLSDVFHPPGGELIDSQAADWTDSPPLFANITDPNYSEWALYLNGVWKNLTRRMKPEVRQQPNRTSLIYSGNPFVVPGGRFKEFYYWDTYWAISGLLISNMTTTAAGMIDNLIDLVNEMGFVPNGGRVYYKNRSQPPFLTLMVAEYLARTNDMTFVKDRLYALAREHKFWSNREVGVLSPSFKPYLLHHYATPLGSPRPESYYEDMMTMKEAGYAENSADAERLFSDIASAAESGWDFSSRWFGRTGPHALEMASIHTAEIIPVCLNSILCKVERHLADMHDRAGNKSGAAYYAQLYKNRVDAVEDVLWNEKERQWQDLNHVTMKHTTGFYASNLYPLWAGCYRKNTTRIRLMVDRLKDMGVLSYVGGVPTSQVDSGQQWDSPNAWPPLQDIAETALRESGLPEGEALARKLAEKWLASNYKAWRQTGHMFEKYSANVSGNPGRGGEYKVQVGFGWTNGVVLKFLERYSASQAPAPDGPGNHAVHVTSGWTVVCLLAIIAGLFH